ncbi:MAG: hypothetical protein HRU15_19200 [Planctomycetes bacterium]|nr:hypothetical protein [Planctomycetota bacterium]
MRTIQAVISVVLLLYLCAVSSFVVGADGSQLISHMKAADVLALGERQSLQIQFAAAVKDADITIEWLDSKGRICERLQEKIVGPSAKHQTVLHIKSPIGYHHSIRVYVNDILQAVSKSFIIEYPYEKEWKDYRATVWAHYDKAYAPLLREAGVTASIWSGENGTAADMELYPDNILYETFAYYHKRRDEHGKMKELWEGKPEKRTVHHRRPSLTDSGSYDKVRERLENVLPKVKHYRPMFYNLADEIGIADQSAVSDLDWEYSNRTAWRVWLQKKYRDLNALNAQWGTDYDSWHAVRAFFPSTHTLYDELWVRNLLPLSFPQITDFQKHFHTQHQSFADFIAAYEKIRANNAAMKAEGLKERFRNKIESFNAAFLSSCVDFTAAEEFVARWELWVSQQDAADSRAWNLSWWCDWRMYMDHYMARGLQNAKNIAQEMDPEATAVISSHV